MNTNYKKWLIGQITCEIGKDLNDLLRLTIPTLELLWQYIMGLGNPREVFDSVKAPYLQER